MCWSPPVDKVGNSVHGNMDVVLFLTQSCKVNPFVKDWWGNIPRDDAMQFGREDVVKVLEEYEQNYSLQTSQTETDHSVFSDTDEVKSVSVTEGDSVTLNTDVTEVQRDDQILWMFGPKETRIAEIYKQIIDMFSSNKTFGDRLQLDSFTGSLTIRNIRTTDSGLYKQQIRSNRGNSDKTFNVTVY
ncbi:hypothetical protein QQF64_019414, partial [Cirrhinus molitorella]